MKTFLKLMFNPFLLMEFLTFYAVEDVSSTVVTNSAANPLVLSKAQIARGRVMHARGVCVVPASASIASKFRFFRVKSNDMVNRLLLDCVALGVGCLMDVGLYQTPENGGAVVDADLFASAVDVAAALRSSDITTESGIITVANMEKSIWELLGLSADPQIEYTVVGTLTAAAVAGGAVCLRGEVVGRT